MSGEGEEKALTLDSLLEFSKTMKDMMRLQVEILSRLDDIEDTVGNYIEPTWTGGNMPRREMNAKEAADYLCISTHRLYRLTRAGLVPYHRTASGHRLVYVESELCEYMNTRGVQRVHTRYDDEREAREYLLSNPNPKLPPQSAMA